MDLQRALSKRGGPCFVNTLALKSSTHSKNVRTPHLRGRPWPSVPASTTGQRVKYNRLVCDSRLFHSCHIAEMERTEINFEKVTKTRQGRQVNKICLQRSIRCESLKFLLEHINDQGRTHKRRCDQEGRIRGGVTRKDA